MKTSLKYIVTCGGCASLQFSILSVALLNVLAGIVFCADSMLGFLPILTVGDIMNNLLLPHDEAPVFFVGLPQVIFLSFSLMMLYGAVKNQAQFLYACLIYGICRISIAVFTIFMLAGNNYHTTDFLIALRSHYVCIFVGGLFYNAYTLLLVRWSIIDIATKCQDQRVKVTSGIRVEKYPLEEKPSKLFIETTV